MKYSFTMNRINHDGDLIWVAKSNELIHCYGVGDTQEEALDELAENEKAWLETAVEKGYPIPEVRVEKATTYSGKLTLRISPKEHEAAAKQSAAQGISLNQYLSDAVVSYSSRRMLMDLLDEKIDRLTALASNQNEVHLHLHQDLKQYSTKTLDIPSIHSGEQQWAAPSIAAPSMLN